MQAKYNLYGLVVHCCLLASTPAAASRVCRDSAEVFSNKYCERFMRHPQGGQMRYDNVKQNCRISCSSKHQLRWVIRQKRALRSIRNLVCSEILQTDGELVKFDFAYREAGRPSTMAFGTASMTRMLTGGYPVVSVPCGSCCLLPTEFCSCVSALRWRT